MKNLYKIVSIVLALALFVSMSASGILTVDTKAVDGVGTWDLVTDASTLKAGDIITIANSAKGFVAGNEVNDKGRLLNATGQLTFSSDKKSITTLPDDAVVLTLGGQTGAWTLSNGTQLLGASSSTALTWSSKTTWTISINSSTGDATIGNIQAGNGCRFMYNVSSKWFTLYKSTTNVSNAMLLPQIYRWTPIQTTDEIDDGSHIKLSVHSLELKEQLHIRHFVHITDTSVEIDATTHCGLQYWTPEDYAALTLVNGQPAFDAEPTQAYDFVETATPNGEDDKYYATTGGIVAADINDVQYIRAYITIGDVTYYTPIQAYSVATYLSAVEEAPNYGVDSDLYKTVEALIAYGEAAAKLFG